MKKTLIAVPCMDSVPARFCQSIAMLNKMGNNTGICFQIGSLIYSSRENLARRAVEYGAEYIMWLDSDMVFEPDLMQKLFERIEDGTIVSGLYFRRVPPFTPVLFTKLDIDEKGCHWEAPKDVPSDKPFGIAACGFGAVLMPTDACVAVFNKFGTMFSPIGGIGEDLAFSWRARQCGYKIICDPNIKLGHVGYTVVNAEFYDAYSKNLKE